MIIREKWALHPRLELKVSGMTAVKQKKVREGGFRVWAKVKENCEEQKLYKSGNKAVISMYHAMTKGS